MIKDKKMIADSSTGVRTSPLLCAVKIQLKKDKWVYNVYYPCDKKVKYRVRYKSSVKKDTWVEECLCGTHTQALIKNADRVKKRTGFDSELSVMPL